MELSNIIIVMIGCVVLGIAGGFAARSFWAGVILAVFVFIGWFLWRMFKAQNGDQEPIEEEKKQE